MRGKVHPEWAFPASLPEGFSLDALFPALILPLTGFQRSLGRITSGERP
jgi:hypothetical protein